MRSKKVKVPKTAVESYINFSCFLGEGLEDVAALVPGEPKDGDEQSESWLRWRKKLFQGRDDEEAHNEKGQRNLLTSHNQ